MLHRLLVLLAVGHSLVHADPAPPRRLDGAKIALRVAKPKLAPKRTALPAPTAPPDLRIERIDLTANEVFIINAGRGPVPAGRLVYLAWSQGWYTKSGWNSMTLVTEGPLEPGARATASIWGRMDAGTQFKVDPDDLIEESVESNNCVDVAANVIACTRK